MNMNMIYCKGDKFWVGKLLEYPDIMTQGETLEELEENMKDAYMLMAMDEATAYLMKNPKNAERLNAAIADLEAGRGIEREIIDYRKSH